MGGQPASLNPDPSLKKRRVGIAALLALALALIGYVTVEINHKARLFGQPAAEESLGAFRQLSVQYAFLVLSAHQASSDPVSELKRLRKEFKSFHSKSELLSASQYYQDLPRTHPLKLNINKVQKFLSENAPLIEQSNAQLKTTLPNLVKDLRNLQTPIKIISEAPANSLIASPQAESALTPWIYLRLALLTILAGFSISLAAILIARQRAARATPSAKKDTQIPRPESLAASAHDAVLNLSKDGIITEYKNNAEPMFGYTKEEALERNIEDLLIPPKLLNRYRKELKPFALSPIATPEHAQRFKTWLQRKSGETFPAEISFQPIAPGARSRISVVIRDLTQEKAKQKNIINALNVARQSEQQKTAFIATNSHEMRNPLQGLLGALKLLNDTDLYPIQKRYVETMDASGRMLLAQIENALDISKVNEAQAELRADPIQLDQLIAEVITSHAALSDEKGNEIRHQWVHSAAPDILGDKVKLQQILLNLLSNATQFTRDGKILIETEIMTQSPDAIIVEFRVRDTGIGITPDRLGRIYDDFETSNQANADFSASTGLGLGIVRRLVDLMGGQLSAESAFGEGSTFLFRIAFKPHLPALETPLNLARFVNHLSPINILMVEDNEINRFILQEMLKLEGHQVTEAKNGKCGVEAAAKQKFDLILIDISMPVMDGIEASRRIRSSGCASADTPIIAVTAHAMPDEIDEFLAAGINDKIIKPIDRRILLEKIRLYCPQSAPKKDPLTDRDASGKIAILDQPHIQDILTQLGADKLQNLMQQFIHETDEMLKLLDPTDAGSKGKLTKETIELVHRAAGSAAVLGALALHQKLNMIELAARSDRADQVSHLIENIGVIWNKTQSELAASIAQKAR